MDEQRILEEMERVLAADDPRLAARLASFGRPGFSQVLRTRRARAVLSLMTLAVIAVVAVFFYAMTAFRLSGAAHSTRTAHYVTPSALARPGAQPSGAVRCAATVAPRACTAWTALPGPRR